MPALSICRPVHLACMSACMSSCLYARLPVCLSAGLSVCESCMSSRVSANLSCLPACLRVCLPICLRVCLLVCLVSSVQEISPSSIVAGTARDSVSAPGWRCLSTAIRSTVRDGKGLGEIGKEREKRHLHCCREGRGERRSGVYVLCQELAMFLPRAIILEIKPQLTLRRRLMCVFHKK